MAPSITLTSTAFSGASTRKVYASALRVSHKKNNTVAPLENGTAAAYVQTNSYENPRYVLDNVMLQSDTGYLTYTDVLTLLRTKYGVTNAPTITIAYGTASTLVGVDGTTTAIKVILDSADFSFDTRDSKDARLPVGTLTFIETK
jgi:hypothetical protein